MISKSNNFSINNRFDDKIPKIVDNQTYLQALGVLKHELYFGKLPSNILQKSENKEFDDLIVKLLEKILKNHAKICIKMKLIIIILKY